MGFTYLLNRCRTSLLFWLEGQRKLMPFAVPMAWREQRDHVTDCCFCITNVRSFLEKISPKFFTPRTSQPLNQFSTTQICLYLGLQLKKKDTLSIDERASTGTKSEEDLIESDAFFQHESAPLLINQERFNDLVHDLYIFKEKAKVLGSRLKQWNLLESGTIISFFCSESKNLLVIMQVQKIYAIAKIYCRWVDGRTGNLFIGGCLSTPAKQALIRVVAQW